LGLSLLLGTPVLLLFNWLVRVSSRLLLVLDMAGLAAAYCALRLRNAAAQSIFNKFEPLAQSHSRAVAKLETVVARTGTHIASRAYVFDESQRPKALV